MSVLDFLPRRAQTAAAIRIKPVWASALGFAGSLILGASALTQTPAVGAKAPDLTLSTPTGNAVKMSTEQGGHGLVLAMLRGFPGYQCPYCVKQVHDFVVHASEFKAKNTKVLLVYPGPPA